MMAEGRVALRRGALSEAISVLQAALDMAERTDSREFELEINDLLATAFKRSGRFEEALDRREKHDSQYRQMFTHATDLRLRTLQVAHETATARQQAEILRLRTHELEAMVTTDGQPIVRSANQLDAFERLAVLAEFRDTDTGQHTKRVGDMAAEIAHARGENPDWAERLRLAARLHDIGKVSVPDAVLLKSGPLTVEEFEIMKTHTTVGNQILAGSSSPLFQMASEIAHLPPRVVGRQRLSVRASRRVDRAVRPHRRPRRRVRRAVQPAGRTSGPGRWARPPGSSCPAAAPSSSPTSSTPSSPCCSPATPSSKASWDRTTPHEPATQTCCAPTYCEPAQSTRRGPPSRRRRTASSSADRSIRPLRQALLNDDTAPSTPSASSVGIGVGDLAIALRLTDVGEHVAQVDVAAFAQHGGQVRIGALDLEQGEVRRRAPP